MTYDRKAIMTEAWQIVRRFPGNGETLRGLRSRALKLAWATARRAAEVTKALQAREEAREQIEALSADELTRRIEDMEDRDRLGMAGHDHPSELCRAHVVAKPRDAEANAAKRDLNASAKGRSCRVAFTKKDGSVRQMTVQPAALRTT